MPTYRASSKTIACTLTTDELRDTQSAWRKLLGTALVARDEIPGGIRLVVNEASADALAMLIDIERDCCRWITFDLQGASVSATAEGAGEGAIRQMWMPPA